MGSRLLRVQLQPAQCPLGPADSGEDNSKGGTLLPHPISQTPQTPGAALGGACSLLQCSHLSVKRFLLSLKGLCLGCKVPRKAWRGLVVFQGLLFSHFPHCGHASTPTFPWPSGECSPTPRDRQEVHQRLGLTLWAGNSGALGDTGA